MSANALLQFVPKGMSLKRTYSNGGTTTVHFGSYNYVYDYAEQSDGKVIIVGGLGTYNDVFVGQIARIDKTDGELDTAFNTNIGVGAQAVNSSDNYIYAVAIQSDGKILAGGGFDYFNGIPQQGLVRLNANGTPDTAFNTNVANLIDTGTGNGYYINSIALQSDGKIILGGSFLLVVDEVGEYRVGKGYVRLNSDGTYDFTLVNGEFTYGPNNSVVKKVVVQSDDKILISGLFSSWLNASTPYSVGNLVRLNANGTLDTTFTTALGTGTNNTVYALALQSDGSVIFGGNFTSFNGTTCKIARVSSSGTFDTSFNTNVGTGPGTSSPYVFSISVQSNGKILVAGDFTSWSSTTVGSVVRLNSDGTRDTAFTTANGSGSDSAYSQIRVVGQLASEDILVAGYFSSWNGTTIDNIITLSSAGTRNTTFIKPPDIVFAIVAGAGGGVPDIASDIVCSGGGAGAVVMGLVPFRTSVVIGAGGRGAGGQSRYSTLLADGGAAGVSDSAGTSGTRGAGGSGGSNKYTSTSGGNAGGSGSTLFTSLGGAGGAGSAPSSGDSVGVAGGSGTSGGGGGAASYGVVSGTGTVTGGSGGSGLVGGGGGGAGTARGSTAGAVTGGYGGSGLYAGGTVTVVTGTAAFRYSSGGGGGGLLGAGQDGTTASGSNNNRRAGGSAGGLGGGGAGGGVGDFQSDQGANGGNGCVLLYW